MSRISQYFKQDAAQYARAVLVIRDKMGSFEQIARACQNATGVAISGNAIRLWFMFQSIPLEYCALFQDLTSGEVDVDDFFPWLNEYL